MSDTSTLPIDSVNELVEERERFLNWIEQLDARRDGTPEHVYTRVRADYTARLDAVVEQLTGHAAEIRSAVDGLAERVRGLRGEERQRQDERCEAELRAAVGEFSAERWHDIQREVDDTLARLADERGSAETELARLEHVMTLAVTPESTPVVPLDQSEEEAQPVDVAAILQSQPDHQAEGAAAHSNAASRPAEHSQAARSAPRNTDELEFLKRVIQPSGAYPVVPETAAPPKSSGSVRKRTDPKQPLMWPADIADAARDLGRENTSPMPVGMREGTSEQIKTLKCQECGTMNYPTEWYCERCGGELAAM